jgi:hypothetical protein
LKDNPLRQALELYRSRPKSGKKKSCKILFILSDYSFTLHRAPGDLRLRPASFHNFRHFSHL